MRHTALLVVLLGFAGVATAQVPTAKGASLEAKRANDHYKRGWESMRKEAWEDAAKEFQSAIDSDDRFALAYYSLGRAHMGRHDFSNAITAYTKCRELYLNAGGDRLSNQSDTKRIIEDRILELQTTIQQAQQGPTGKGSSQSQSLYLRELQNNLDRLQEARNRSNNVQIEISVPYFVPMALGAAYFRNNQFAEAEREYLAAIQANPGSGETHNNLAVLYLLTNRIDLAEKEVAKAEETGFKVNPGLKDDIRKRKS